MTIFGWDMSHYDAPSIGSALSEGISFITHKAGGDSSSGDSELDEWWSNVKPLALNNTLLTGTYWVPRPDLYPSAAGEADRWIARLDAACPGWRSAPHILQVDAEIWGGDSATKPSLAYLQRLCARLRVLMPRLVPIVYASKGQYGNALNGLGYPLWNANYPSSTKTGFKALYSRVGGDSGPGWTTYSGQMPKIWQYGSSASIGGQTTCDANAFRGTLAELSRIVAPGWMEEDVALTTDEIAAVAAATVKALTTNVDFTDEAGGFHNPLSDALLNAKQVPGPDGKRGYVWPLLSLIPNLATAAAVAALPTAEVQAIISGVLAGLPAEQAQQIISGVSDEIAKRLAS